MRHLFIPILAVLTLAACARQPGRQAVAVVNGEAITAADVAAMLPENLDSLRADTVKKQVLDGIITRKLFAQEAKREGLDKDNDVQYQVELEQKALVNQRLYDTITAPGNLVTEAALQSAYKLLQTEAHLRLISVPDESLARRLAAELDQGAVFETLVVKYSKHPTAARAGDAGFMPLLALDEPLRTNVGILKPGQHTQPTQVDNAWQIVMLVETRPANPAPPPLDQYRPQLEQRLKQQQRREIANQYLADLRQRVTYNPAGLEIMCKPLDSITAAEKETAVAYKDKARYVKVARLLPVAARFPAMLDTAMKKYAVRRAIEEDLIYEDALHRGLDKLPDIRLRLKGTLADVLFKALLKKEITDKLAVSDADVMDYFRQNRQNLAIGQNPTMSAASDSIKIMGMIRSRLLNERRDARMQQYVDGLKAKAKITINQAALAALKKETKAPGKPGR